MVDQEWLEEEPKRRESSFQFGLLSLLVLTTAVAVVLAVLRTMNLPVFSYVLIAGYAAFFLLYFVLRGIQQWRGGIRLRRQVFEKRRLLDEWVKEKRNGPHEGGKTNTDSDPTNREPSDL